MVLEFGANNIVVTLNEKKTLDSPGYVLILVSDESNKKVACKLGAELSEYPERYNKFLLTVKTSPIALNSEVNLKNYGSYKYYIYEMTDADTFNYSTVDSLDLETMSGLVEQGRVKYITDAEEIRYYRNVRQSVKTYKQ